MLIPVTQIKSFGRREGILVETSAIKKVMFVNRNHTEPCADIHMKDGSIIKTIEYRSGLKSSGVCL